MKKNIKKKTLTAVTGATVIGVAAAALANGAKLEKVFNPDKFEKFDNKYSSDDYDYVAGDGEDTNIAGNSDKKKEKSGGDDLQVLQLQKKEAGDLKSQDSFGIADNGSSYKDADTPEEKEAANNAIELSQEPETKEADKTPSQAENNNPNTTSQENNNTSGNNHEQAQNGNGNSGNGNVTVTPIPGKNNSPSSEKNPTGTPSPTKTPGSFSTPTPTPVNTPVPETPTPTPETPAPKPTEPTPTPVPETPTPEPDEPTPTPVPDTPTPIPDEPTPTPVPETPTPEPDEPTPTPVPETPTPTEPTPTPIPATPTPTPKPWEDRQLDDKDPVTTEDGQLTALSAEITKEYYTFGETYQEEDGKVTATFLRKDGTSIKKELSYGGTDGYSVTLSTLKTGKQIAVFTYKGRSARAYYTVLKNKVSLGYMASYNGDVYISDFPGIPLKELDEEFYKELNKYTETPYAYATNGKFANLLETHRRYIAVLGNSEIREKFTAHVGQSYSNTVFLETDKEGYLTNMLEGFRWVLGQKLEDARSYLYYPMDSWDELSRNVLDYVTEVPKGYKIRRVTENEDFVQYTADQVLEKYTGTDSVLSVPMGVTKVSLNEKNSSVKTFEIPQSVQSIDVSTIGENLPALENYQVADGDSLRTFKIVDGILYSADGKTLLSVPAGRKNVEIPATVTALGKDCLKGLSSDTVVTFKSEKPPAIKESTGFKGIVQVPDSKRNTAYKNYMFHFGEECSQITFETESGEKDLYEYSSEGPVLLEHGADAVLAAVPQDTRGEYTVGDGIKAIGENAFADCSKLTDLVLGKNIKELKAGSLIVSKHVDSITIQNPDIQIAAQLFGKPGSDETNLNIRIYVPGESYDSMVSSWSSILDPVYGEGTAKSILHTKDENSYVYENGVKYQKITSEGETQYRLMRVYQTNQTAIQIKAGTTEIAAGAFSDCTALEILFVPETVKKAGEDFLSDCTALETVVSENKELFAGENYGAVSAAEIFTAGDAFTDFTWDEGVVYGTTADGYTLLNVPTDYNKTLVIQKTTTALYRRALKNCGELSDFLIPDENSLREIGEECFEGCLAVNSVDLEKCENLKEIGDRAFYSCTNLVTATLPKSLEKIGSEAFYNCTQLEKIIASGVKEIGDSAFYGCGSLMTADIFTSVESLGDNVFYGCTGLTEVVLPETLGSMGESCFENCTALKNVTIDGTITGISRYCFYGCRELKNIIFKDSSQRSVSIRVIGVQAFGNCTSLETIDLSTQESLTAMGEGVFTECESLTTVKLPKQLSKIPDNCFNACPNLSILQIESETAPELGEKIFGDTLPSFLHIWVKDGMTETYQSAYQPVLDPVYGEGTTASVLGVINDKQEIIKGVLFELTEEGRVLERASTEIEGDYIIPDDTVRIADNAFEGCDKLTGFAATKNTTVSLGNRCFKGCTSLKDVRLLGSVPEWGEETFMDCTELETLYLGNSSDSVINTIGVRAFKNCTGLKTDGAVEIRARITAYGEECFAGCTNLTAVSMSEQARTALQVIGNGAFRDCTSLRAFLVSKMSGLTYIGDYAFANCDTLKQPSVPAKVTYVGEGCFMDCDNVQYVSFYCGLEEYPKYCFKNCPKLIRTGGTAAAFNGLKRIGEGAYEGCVSLTASSSWNLGRYANLEEIGDRAFYGCMTLADSVLSTKMTGIGASAFEGCSSLHALWIQTETPPAFGAFAPENMAADFCIRVPDSQAADDSIYKAYLEKLTEVLGKEKAYEILDSFSDGAKDRQAAEAFEEETESESGTDAAIEGAENAELKIEEVPGETEEASKEAGDTLEDENRKVQETEDVPETPAEDAGENSADQSETPEESDDSEAESSDKEETPEQEEAPEQEDEAEGTQVSGQNDGAEETQVSVQNDEPEKPAAAESTDEKEKAKENEQ